MEARTPKEMGKIMEELRKDKGLTQEELSEKANVSLKDIKNIEDGYEKTSAVSFLKVFRALEVKNPDEIIYK